MDHAILLGIVLIALGGLAATPAASAISCYEDQTPALVGLYGDFDNAHVEAGPVAVSCEYTLPP